LANTKSAMKRIRSSERKRQRNLQFRARARTLTKRTWRLIEAERLEEAQTMAELAIKALDKASVKGIIHKNNAARRKSRLMKRLNQALRAQQATQ